MTDKKKRRAEPTEAEPHIDTETVEEKPETDTEPEANTEAPVDEAAPEVSLEEQLLELNDKLLRSVAEFDNYRKRMTRQMENVISNANDQLLAEFLEVVDNFERALTHDNNNSDAEAFRKGIEMILGQMTGLLARYSVTPIEALGQPFDPNLHEAMMQVDSDKYDDGMVALEIGKGYRLGDRVLRHSRVGVSTGAKKETDEKAEDE